MRNMDLPLLNSSELLVIFHFIRGLYHTALQCCNASDSLVVFAFKSAAILICNHTLRDVYMTLFHTQTSTYYVSRLNTLCGVAVSCRKHLIFC
jgi:hypothetical protein